MKPASKFDESNDPVWKLLGKLPAHRASDQFVDQVIHALKTSEITSPKSSPTNWLHFLAPTAAAAALLLACLFALNRAPDSSTTHTLAHSPTPHTLTTSNEESHIINLDELDINGSLTEQLLGLDEEQFLSAVVEFDRLISILDPMDIHSELNFVSLY